MKTILREAVLNDYMAIASWITDQHSCTQWAGPLIQYPFSADVLPQLLAVTNSESYCLVNGSGKPLGFGQLWFGKQGSIHLMRIIVSPQIRGEGLGRELCRQLIIRALDGRNTRSITLRVYCDNTDALALYTSLGFSPIDLKSTNEALFMELIPGDQGPAM